MKIVLDGTTCQGHGRCYEIAPESFIDDERGRGQVVRAEVVGEAAWRAGEAARACPEGAITVED